MSRLKNNLVFYIIMIVNICVLPIFIRDTGSAILIMRECEKKSVKLIPSMIE